jgi:biopolymer transport protein ExbD
MRLARRRRTTRPGFNMTPMIDIVFLLIIFFMTVTQVSEVNKEVLDLPKLQGSEDQKATVLTVNITADGEIRISGRAIDFSTLVSLIESEKLRLGDARLLTVNVRTDQRGTSRATNEVVRTLGELDIRKIRIAVESDGSS